MIIKRKIYKFSIPSFFMKLFVRPVRQERKLLQKVLAAKNVEDITKLLHKEKLRRYHIVEIAKKYFDVGKISKEDFLKIRQKTEKSGKFPKDSEKRLETLLCGVINSEKKQILTMFLKESPKELTELAKTFEETTNVYLRPMCIDLTLYFLHQMGLVGCVFPQKKGKIAIEYMLMKDGKHYAQPIAAFCLHLTNQLGLSFYQVFGATQSKGKSRCPYNRFRILEELINGEKSIGYLVKTLNISDGGPIASHLTVLKKIGFIDYETIINKRAIYEWLEEKPEKVKPVRALKTLTKDVVEYLYKQKQANKKEITNYLIKVKGYGNWKERSLNVNVGAVLIGLAKQGFTRPKYLERSHVWLTKNGKDFAEEFTRKIRNALNAFQDGNELKAMRKIYLNYMKNHDLFVKDATNGMQKYLSASSYSKENRLNRK